MSTPRDDDALSWGGDDDPTLDVGEKRAPGRASAAESGPATTAPHRRDGEAHGHETSSAEALQPEPEQPEPVQFEPLQPEPEPEPEALQPTPSGRASHPEAESGVDETHDETDAAHAAPLGNVGLVGIGMVAATFLLFAIGWLAAGLQLRGLGLPIPDVTVLAMTVGAALAPLVWFVSVLVLTRTWRTWQRFLLLIVGIVLLVPWPFLSLGVFA